MSYSLVSCTIRDQAKLIGMMHLFYVVWDYTDERLFDKRNTSDCAQFSELLGWPTSGEWHPTDLSILYN